MNMNIARENRNQRKVTSTLTNHKAATRKLHQFPPFATLVWHDSGQLLPPPTRRTKHNK